MSTEAEAYRVWWSLHPTLADAFLFLTLTIFGMFLWFSIMSNRKERKQQINDIKNLVVNNITEIKVAFADHIKTMKDVVEKLQDEKRMISEHLVRHEQIAADILRLCKTIDDHEDRIRITERWTGKERRGCDDH